MKKLFLLLALAFAAPIGVFAQYEDDEQEEEAVSEDDQDANEEVVDGIVRKQHVKGKKPLMPAYVREANVLWSKTVWRIIDLRQKRNLYLYYPIESVDDRKSLAQTLYDGILSGEITAYSTNTNNEFERKMSPFDAYTAILKNSDEDGEAVIDSVVVANPETGEDEVHYQIQGSAQDFTEIRQFWVKEVWFFDKRYGRMDVRIIGLCPLTFRLFANGTQRAIAPLFWVYYPEAAGVLSRQEAYSYGNDAQRVSLRDKLETRQFDSYIYKVSNVYDNRNITSIASNGIDQNMMAQEIQADIFRHEHDMWEY